MRTSTPSTDRLAFETLISDISGRLLGAPFEDLDLAVEATLDDIRTFFRADRCGLLSVSADRQIVRVTHASYTEGVLRVSGDINLVQYYPWCRQKLIDERVPVLVSRMADLPPEAAVDRASWDYLSTRSNLAVPIQVGPVVSHLFVIHTVSEERDFSDAYVPRLRLLGEMLVNALERKQAFLALRASEERLERAAAAAGCGLWELDIPSGSVWVTPVTRRLYGLDPDESATYDRFVALVHADDREAVVASIVTAMSGDGPFDELYRIVLGDGTVRWMHATGRAHGPNRLLGVSVDVTHPVLATDLAREQSARLAAAVDVAELGFSEWSVGAGRPFLDDRLRTLLDIGPENEERPQEVWLSRLHHDDRERLLEMRRQLLAGEIERLAIEYRYDHPRRGVIWLRHVSRRLGGAGEHGDSPRLIGAVQDITERKQREEDLRQALDEVQRLRDRLQRENVYLRQEVRQRHGPEHAIGRSPAIRRALALAEQVATTDSTVLLLGETGSGKERFASFIHDASRRRERTMIRVNCSAIPTALIESELFGREKGAYTGALSKQVGRFELAHGSTLFLDEIGDLPLEIQVKLLRALEEHTIERLGNPRPVPVDVRIVAATHRDLERAVREGTFREDLYYRLNVFPITVPSLRERQEDIPLLVEAFVDEFAAAMGKRIEAIDPANMEALVAYAWPGNVRELRNAVERAMILSDGRTLQVEVPHADLGRVPNPAHHLTAVERAHLLQVLHEAGWRIRGPRGAAARLGLKPTTLESRIRKLGILRPGTTIVLSCILRNVGDWTSLAYLI